MEFLNKYKNILLVLFVVALIGIAFVILSRRDSGDDSLLVSERAANLDGSLDADLVSLLLTLRSVELDESVFTNPAFISLKDFGQELVPEPVGRSNPFAPVGVERVIPPVIENTSGEEVVE